ncbi:MAG: septal ring lytic transglycosylase RlpA family protein [Hyphomicrobiaceae bacterium]|nr:septal ring lytic transglycosylase RlpA family protein [Hyphomicrobiaceae bacterium]
MTNRHPGLFFSLHNRQPNWWLTIFCISLISIILDCGCTRRNASPSISKFDQAANSVHSRHGGYYKLGKPYKINGKIYFPRHDKYYDRIGVASWYGGKHHGRQTANGEIYDENILSGAHPTLPLPSYVRVTNLENNLTVVVRINDRGPFVPGRIIDLSSRAARELKFITKGLAKVRVEYIRPAPL